MSSKKLGRYLYDNLKNNTYLRKLVKILLIQYAYCLFGVNWKLTQKQKNDLLRFADLLSKSINESGAAKQRNLALRIIALLTKMYPQDPDVAIVNNEVLSSLKNFLPRNGASYKQTITLSQLWNEAINDYQKRKRQIPGQRGEFFFGKQDEIFQSLGDYLNSFSAPTSMGKTFLIKKYIEFKITSGGTGNFAITVPSKALITEVRSSLIDALGGDLAEYSYRVVSRAEEYGLDYQTQNFIFVMTPERLSNLLMQNPDLRLEHLFIDESQKITEEDSRSIFYYEIFDQIKSWERKPKITFASPLIPNPGIFKQLISDQEDNNGISISESPVTQVKFIIDRYSQSLLGYDDLTHETFKLSKFSENLLPHIILDISKAIGPNKQSLIYYSSKAAAISDAVIVARQAGEINDSNLNSLADYIARKIHPNYVLVSLVKKGIAFHTGELPIDVRTKIEDAYRQGILKFVFCTSTLLEGVNLPADNIFVTSLNNGQRKLTPLEFLNLIGRVGRLNHSMVGNVFLITGEKKNSRSNLDAYLKDLNNDLKKEKLSVEKVIKPKQAAAIKQSLRTGNIKLEQLKNDKNYDLIRKLSLLYIQEIKNDCPGIVRRRFSLSINNDDEQQIINSLSERYTGDLEEDINFSSDQSEKLKREISNTGIQKYPSIFIGEKLNVSNTRDFLLKLSDIFNWQLYEKKFIAANQSPEIQDEIINDYTKLTLLWIAGFSLKQICGYAILIRNNGDPRFLDRLDQYRSNSYNIDWDTITINAVMRQLQNIQFVLGKYFLKVTTELTKNGIPPENDWYRFMEYGTDSDLRIWLQQNGYSRESSAYIEDNKDEFIIQVDNNYFVSKNILKANDLDTVSETKEIEINVPEIFI